MLPALEVWLVTVAAHTFVGGSLPSLPWLASVAGLVAVTTGCVVGGSASWRLMVPVLTAAQVALHVVLTWLPVGGDAHPAHAGHAMPAASAGGPIPFDLSWRMVLAHLLSGALTALVWRLRRRAIEVLLGLDGVLASSPRTATRPVVSAGARGFRSLPWLLGDPGRAPPLVPATA
jgi:hypothetical protein